MRSIPDALLAIGLSAAVLTTNLVPAHANDGRVAAGFLGGLFAGTVLGSALTPRPYHPPQPIYVAPARVYSEPSCYLTRGEPVWDGYGWIRPYVEICD